MLEALEDIVQRGQDVVLMKEQQQLLHILHKLQYTLWSVGVQLSTQP